MNPRTLISLVAGQTDHHRLGEGAPVAHQGVHGVLDDGVDALDQRHPAEEAVDIVQQAAAHEPVAQEPHHRDQDHRGQQAQSRDIDSQGDEVAAQQAVGQLKNKHHDVDRERHGQDEQDALEKIFGETFHVQGVHFKTGEPIPGIPSRMGQAVSEGRGGEEGPRPAAVSLFA